MTFYERLSEYYDEIFSFHKDDSIFLNKLLKDKNMLLDVGCGTGNKM